MSKNVPIVMVFCQLQHTHTHLLVCVEQPVKLSLDLLSENVKQCTVILMIYPNRMYYLNQRSVIYKI